MVRIPGPDEKVLSEASSKFPLFEPALETTHAVNKHIDDADHWATDWELRELKFERDARQTEHGMFIAALHKVCRDCCRHALNTFPLGVARWLEKEIEKVFRNLPSQILKSPIEGTQTANLGQSNQFEVLREDWGAKDRIPALLLQTPHKAREFDFTPPDWAIEQLVNAGARVFETNGEVGFEEALGLTPRKIKFALSDQKKNRALLIGWVRP